MKIRQPVFVLVGACAVIAAAWLLVPAPEPNIDPLTAANLLAAAEELSLHAPDGAVAPARWPAEIRQFNPETVRITPEGVYLMTEGFFVTERGIFILNPHTSFRPEQGGDPSYRPIADRIYWYEIKG